MSGLLLNFKFRLTNAASGNPTSVLADAPYGIVDRIRVFGKHVMRRSDEVIVSLSGAEVAELQRQNTRYAMVNTPTTLSVSASATNDVQFVLYVPFVPSMVHPNEMANYLVDGPGYQNLSLEIKWADAASIFAGQTTATTLSAFGSTTGSPSVEVSILQAMEPATQFRGFLPGLYTISSRPLNTGVLLNTANQVRLTDLNRGGRLRKVVLKTGTLATGTSSGNTAFATWSDAIVSRIAVNRGTNRTIWDSRDFFTARIAASISQPGAVLPSTGHLVCDWVKTGNFQELLDATGLVAGPTGDIDFYLSGDVTGNSNQYGTLITEEVISTPTVLTPRG